MHTVAFAHYDNAGALHESQVAWSPRSGKRSDDRARRLSILPTGVSPHGISAGGPEDGGRSSLSPRCAVLQSHGRNPLEPAGGLGLPGAATLLRPGSELGRVLERRTAATLTGQYGAGGVSHARHACACGCALRNSQLLVVVGLDL